MMGLLIATLTTVLSYLLSFFTPVAIGGQIEETKNDIRGYNKKSNIIVGRVFGFVNKFEIWGKVFEKVFNGILIIINKISNIIISLIFKRDRELKNEEKSFTTFMAIIITVQVFTVIFILICKAMFPLVYGEVKSLILDNLNNNVFSLEMVLYLTFDSFATIVLIIKERYWFIYLVILVAISIIYISIIFNGMIISGQFQREKKNIILGIKSLTIKNFIIVSAFSFIILFITSNLPAFNWIYTMTTVLTFFNINISLTATGAVITAKVIEVAVEKVIRKDTLEESNIFKNM